MDDNNLITLLQQGDRNANKQLFISITPPFANMRHNIFLMMILKSLCRS